MFPTTSTHSYVVTIAPVNTIRYHKDKLNHRIAQYLDYLDGDIDDWVRDPRNNEYAYGLDEVKMAQNNLSWPQQEAMECLAEYDTLFPSRVGNVILIMPKNDSADIYQAFPVTISQRTTSWLGCPHLGGAKTDRDGFMKKCDIDNPVAKPAAKYQKAGSWTFDEKTVQGCLIEKRIEECTLQFSRTILCTVIH